jgi:serine/threonine-protein kinase
VADSGELLLVMDYIPGESLSRLLRAERERNNRVDPRIVAKIMSEALSGLHAAHEVKDERGMPLGVVHRDVSPQNILVGSDGVAHLIDFGVAKAAGRVQSTREGQLKGKIPYMAPEQIQAGKVDRRTDVYAAAVVLWEALVGERLFKGEEAALMFAVLTAPLIAPSTLVGGVSEQLDAVVMKGLERDPDKRFATALEMADALEAAVSPASSREVARWMEQLATETLRQRANVVAEIESVSRASVRPGMLPPAATEGAKLQVQDSVTVTSGPERLATDTSSVSSATASNPERPRRWLWGAAVAILLAGAGIWFAAAKLSAAPAVALTEPSASATGSAASAAATQAEAAASQTATAAAVSAPAASLSAPGAAVSAPATAAPKAVKAPAGPLPPKPAGKEKPTHARD